MARAPGTDAALLRAYEASANATIYLVRHLDRAVWRAPTPEGGRTIAAMVAHTHNCGLRYLERTDPSAKVPGELDRHRVTPAQAIRALTAKRQAVLRVVGAALREGRRISGFAGGPVRYLTYYMSHEAHHRGQITQLARLVGHPVSRKVSAGLWTGRTADA